jgi:hypothetical protein
VAVGDDGDKEWGEEPSRNTREAEEAGSGARERHRPNVRLEGEAEVAGDKPRAEQGLRDGGAASAAAELSEVEGDGVEGCDGGGGFYGEAVAAGSEDCERGVGEECADNGLKAEEADSVAVEEEIFDCWDCRDGVCSERGRRCIEIAAREGDKAEGGWGVGGEGRAEAALEVCPPVDLFKAEGGEAGEVVKGGGERWQGGGGGYAEDQAVADGSKTCVPAGVGVGG